MDPRTYKPNQIMLIYGPQKIGKSCLTIKLPGRIYIIDVDNGTEPLLNMWQDTGRNFDDIQVAPAYTVEQFHKAIWDLPKGFDFYIIDTYTSAGTRFIEDVTEGELEEFGERKMNQDRWGKVSGRMHDYYVRFKDQVRKRGGWGILLAHEKPVEKRTGPNDVTIYYQPDLVGSAERTIGGDVSLLLHMEIAKTVIDGKAAQRRVIRSAATPYVKAGDRTMSLKDEEPADLGKLLAKIEAKRLERFPAAGVPVGAANPGLNGG